MKIKRSNSILLIMIVTLLLLLQKNNLFAARDSISLSSSDETCLSAIVVTGMFGLSLLPAGFIYYEGNKHVSDEEEGGYWHTYFGTLAGAGMGFSLYLIFNYFTDYHSNALFGFTVSICAIAGGILGYYYSRPGNFLHGNVSDIISGSDMNREKFRIAFTIPAIARF